ncbi:MAG TPA: GspMb/PilO family protein [bacterium]|nr:GspMb/PilO family protein [bacterium]
MKKTLTYTQFYDIYALLFFLCVFVILPFGGYSSISSYTKKKDILSQLQQEEVSLAQAIKEIRDTRYLEEDISPYLDKLHKAVPDRFYGEDFLNEILLLSSASDFTVRSLNVSSEEKFVTVNVSMEGSFENLDSFFTSLENSGSSIIVESFSISFPQRESDNKQTTSLRLKVYSL